MSAAVEMDWSNVERGIAQLGDGIERGSKQAALDQASTTANAIRDATPVRTGALAATVRVVPEGDGAGVAYGGGLRYARLVAHRTGSVTSALDAARRQFVTAETEVAAREVRRL